MHPDSHTRTHQGFLPRATSSAGILTLVELAVHTTTGTAVSLLIRHMVMLLPTALKLLLLVSCALPMTTVTALAGVLWGTPAWRHFFR